MGQGDGGELPDRRAYRDAARSFPSTIAGEEIDQLVKSTNTPEPKSIPKLGDIGDPGLWLSFVLLGLGALAAVKLATNRKRIKG